MSLTLELSPEAERALIKEAGAAGVPFPLYAERLLYRGLNLPERATPQITSLTQLFAAWEAQERGKALTEAEAEAEDAEWDEIAANIERNRVRLPVPDVTDND